MGELIRRIIRWILFVILVVLLILLIVKLINNSGTGKKTKKVLDKGVQEIKKGTKKVVSSKDKDTTKKEEKEKDKEENNIISTIEVTTPDTASFSYLYILGIAILSSGTLYIYKNRVNN